MVKTADLKKELKLVKSDISEKKPEKKYLERLESKKNKIMEEINEREKNEKNDKKNKFFVSSFSYDIRVNFSLKFSLK